MARRGLVLTPEQFAEYQAKARGAVPALLKARPPAPAPNKHGAVQTTRGSLLFASKHEARVWDDLGLRKLAGEITHLQRQVTFTFAVNGVRVGSYRADFFYRSKDGVWHVADAKSRHTRRLPGWARTKHLMHACYGFVVEEL